jgi:hypothetical protein
LAANCGGFGGKTGMYAVPIKCRTRLGYQMALLSDRNDGAIMESSQIMSPVVHKACFWLSVLISKIQDIG